MNNVVKETFDKVVDWLRKDGNEVHSSGPDVDEYKNTHSDIIEMAVVKYRSSDNTNEYFFNLFFGKKFPHFFQIRTVRKFNPQDTVSFANLNPSEQIKYYRDIRKTVYPFGVWMQVTKDNETVLEKRFYIENLTRQYFFDSVYDFIHALELAKPVYGELRKSSAVRGPYDMT